MGSSKQKSSSVYHSNMASVTVNAINSAGGAPKKMTIRQNWGWPKLAAAVQNAFGSQLSVESISHMTFSMTNSSTGTVGDNLGLYPDCTICASLKGADGTAPTLFVRIHSNQ